MVSVISVSPTKSPKVNDNGRGSDLTVYFSGETVLLAPALKDRGTQAVDKQSEKVDASSERIFPKKPKSVLTLTYIHSENLMDLAANTRNLDEIDFSRTYFTEKVMMRVIPVFAKNNPGLKKLNLKEAHLTPRAVIALLEAFPDLEGIDITRLKGVTGVCSIIIDKLKTKHCLKSIQGLEIESPAYLERFSFFAKGLKKLSITYTYCLEDVVFNRFITDLAKNSPGLTQFHFVDFGKKVFLSKELYTQFPKFWQGLVDVKMDVCTLMTSEEMVGEYLLYFTSLTAFYDHNLDDMGVVTVISMFADTLKKIDISDKYLGNAIAICPAISGCHQIEELDLRSLNLFDAMAVLSNILHRLTSLNLNWNQLTKKDIEILGEKLGNAKMTHLEVYLDETSAICSFANISLKKIIERCPNLETLKVIGLEDKDSYHIWSSIAGNTHSLRSLTFDRLVGEDSAKVQLVRTFLENNPALKVVECNIDLEGARLLISEFSDRHLILK